MILVNHSTYKYGKTVNKETKSMTLDKICESMGFHRPVFSSIRTESTILSLYGRILASENAYSHIFYEV